jgi:hypothetical protein
MSSPLPNPEDPTDPPQPPSSRSRVFRTALLILLGLATTQVIASVHVYLSNLALHDKTLSLMDAGYLIVPNSRILPRLLELKPAVFGGLFFTLSIGVFLTLLSLLGAWVRQRRLLGKKALLPVLFTPWLIAVLALNLSGFSLMTTIYFFLVPPLVFISASKWLFLGSSGGYTHSALLHAFVPFLLALLWSTQLGGSFFLDIRDHLLLTHSTGSKVNDFYYRYTLYPAEILKPIDQKLLKSVYLGHLQDRALLKVLQRELLKYDYLPVHNERLADLVLRDVNQELHLQEGGVSLLQVDAKQFLSASGTWLAAFSSNSDRGRPFRKATLISLILGFPMFLYLLVYGISFFLISLILPSRKSYVPATLLCFVAGVLLFFLFVSGKAAVHEEGQVDQALQSTDWRMRVAALKFIRDKELDVARHPAYRNLLESPLAPEKYWLAKALGASKQAQTFKDLLTLLDDSHPTVVSAAFRALGNRKDPAGIGHILTRITTSTDWYNQWNAYQALRALGWKQSPSPS